MAKKSAKTSMVPVQSVAARSQEMAQLLPEELQPGFHSLFQVFERATRNHLLAYYDAGEVIRKHHEVVRKKANGKYRNVGAVINAWAAPLGVNPRTLYTCHHLATTVPRQEYEAWIAEGGISWSHVVRLLESKDETRRDELVKLITSEGLTAAELAAEMAGERSKQPRGAGRPPSTPRSLNQALARLAKDSHRYQRLLSEALFGRLFDITAEIANAKSEDFCDQLRNRVSEGIAALEHVAECAAKTAGRLKESLCWIDESLRDVSPEPARSAEPAA